MNPLAPVLYTPSTAIGLDPGQEIQAVSKAPTSLAPTLRVGRALHIIDVENLNGGPAGNYQSVANMWAEVVSPNPGDLIVCGSDVTGAFAVADAFGSARIVVGTGNDGADRALGRVPDETTVAHRFNTVVVGSGDGYFSRDVVRLRGLGLHVVVVSRSGQTSNALRGAANRVVEIY